MPQSVSRRLRWPRPVWRALVLLAVTGLATAIFATAGALAQVPAAGASADIRDASGRQVATAEFREGRGEVLITIIFPAQPVLTGTHGLHIHDTGRCDPPDYQTAGAIFNPTNKKHGRQNPDGPMVGDLPNVNFTNGLTSYNTSAPGATLGVGATSLLTPARALVFFSGEDDQLTDPDGKAGTRIACGVVVAGPGAAAPVAAQQPAVAAAQPVVSPVVGVAAQPTLPRPTVQPTLAPVQAAQPAQPAPVQAVPARSPVVVPPPAVVRPAGIASPAPSIAVAAAATPALPTPIVVLPTPLPLAAPANSQSSGLSTGTALTIGIVGLVLVAAGILLRQRRQLR